MSEYPLLFSPLTVNQMTLANRIVLPAMHLNYTPGGKVSDQLVAFYTERAKGGAGLIIVGGCTISPTAGGPMLISIQEDDDVEGLKRLVDEVHTAGSKIGAQLYHAGAYAHRALIGQEAVSSSAHTSAFTREEARELSPEEIDQVQNQFAKAARRAKEAGFDMVELLGSAGYLICQFLSPKINRRGDRYGGDLRNRMRFGLETVAKVRQAVGPEFCLGIRIAGHDFVPGSHGNTEAARFAAACEESGVDIINVTGGWHETRIPQLSQEVPPGGLAYLARGVKRAVSCPVCASNRLNHPAQAEEVLARGDADLACIARGFIADPEFAAKAERGRAELIRPCISCNQGCFDAILQLRPVGCALNFRAGNEHKPLPEPSADKGPVAVIGGGPAGCEAAFVAANRGAKVILLEAASCLGGQTTWYADAVHKRDFGAIGRYYIHALAEAGVDVRLGTKADADLISSLRPRAVILATGAEPVTPELPGVEAGHVLDAWYVLQGKARPKGNVLVVGGGAVGLETGLALARRGALTPEQVHYLALFEAESWDDLSGLIADGSHKVTVLEMLPKVGKGVGRSTKWILFALLKRFGVKLETKAKVTSILPGKVLAEVDGEEKEFAADTVIMAAGARPKNSLGRELKERGFTVLSVGDAEMVGNVLDAVAAGWKAGSRI